MNPVKAIEAIFPGDIDVGNGISVKPLSLAHYALLEKIHSYIICDDHEPDSIEVLKTFYICAHDAKDVFKDLDNLGEIALEWGDKLPPYLTDKIIEAISKQIDNMLNVSPTVDDGKKKVTPGTDS